MTITKDSLVNGVPAARGEIKRTFPLDAEQQQTKDYIATKLPENKIKLKTLYIIHISLNYHQFFHIFSSILIFNRAQISKEEFRSSFLTHKRLNPVIRNTPYTPYLVFIPEYNNRKVTSFAE